MRLRYETNLTQKKLNIISFLACTFILWNKLAKKTRLSHKNAHKVELGLKVGNQCKRMGFNAVFNDET